MIASFFVPVVGLLVAAVIGISKEIADMATGQGDPDVYDALATIAGGLLAAAVMLLKG